MGMMMHCLRDALYSKCDCFDEAVSCATGHSQFWSASHSVVSHSTGFHVSQLSCNGVLLGGARKSTACVLLERVLMYPPGPTSGQGAAPMHGASL